MIAQHPSNDRWVAAARRVLGVDTDDFVTLIKLSGLDPKRHLRFADWSRISFRGCDLRGFDFTGARLVGCDFTNALIEGARFDQAEIDHVARNPDAIPSGYLSAAADWTDYAARWVRGTHVPADDHLPAGAVFQDAPYAPQMVIIPPGTSVPSEYNPEREPVTIKCHFAIGRYPVTFKEWQAALSLGGVSHEGRDFVRRYQDGLSETDHRPTPVTDVSWEDAQEYIEWLTKTTGKPYRLLDEEEYRYCEMRLAIGRPEGTTELGIYIHRVAEWCEHNLLDESNAPQGDGLRQRVINPNTRVMPNASILYFEEAFGEAPDEYGIDNDRRVGYNITERDDRIGFRVARPLVY